MLLLLPRLKENPRFNHSSPMADCVTSQKPSDPICRIASASLHNSPHNLTPGSDGAPVSLVALMVRL